jgi:hypothetical protein
MFLMVFFKAVTFFLDTHIFIFEKNANVFPVKQMKNLLKNRLALSTVVTTLIILVVSVLLAGVVTYFAINVTSTRVQEESITMQKIHVWMDGGTGGSAQAAFLLINTGGRDIVINKITVRGQTADWTNVYTASVDPSSPITGDLSFSDLSNVYVDDVADIALTQASGAVVFKSGTSMAVYIDSPDSITLNDIGLTVGVTVFTSQAMYYQEANVQAYVAASGST